MFRILSNFILILSVFLLPVYLSVFLILLSIFLFDNFIEAIAWAFLVDLLYSGGSFFGFHLQYFFTIVVSFFYLVSFRLKTVIRL